MKTFVYIDGFNLYYGSVRSTPYKWLDLMALSRRVLENRNAIAKIKYFTARIKATTADPDGPTRQDAYLRALRAHIPEFQAYEGHFLSHPVTARLESPPPTGTPYVRVIKTDEKGSDVNLAVHLVNDAWLDEYECAVVMSNDSDLAEAIRMVRHYHPTKLVGVLTPVRPTGYAVDGRRPRTSTQLKQAASFVRLIRGNTVAECQLPNPIPGTNIHKPHGW